MYLDIIFKLAKFLRNSLPLSWFKDVQGRQFLTLEAAESLCMVCLPPAEHIFRKKYLGNTTFQKVLFCEGLTITSVFLGIF